MVASPSLRSPLTSPARNAWIDDLRVAVVLGVIGAHVSIIYALDVGWYYEERTAGAIAQVVLAAIFSPALLFGMGLLFFVAGWFTPGALARKGLRRFVTDRALRLGVPTIVYLFAIDPLMNFAGAHAMGEGERLSAYLRRTYWDDVELGVAWFAFALLVFSTAWAVWRARRPAIDEPSSPLRRSDLLRAAAFIALGSFVVRLVWPFLATGGVWGLNLWEYPQMITLFTLGTFAEERGWLLGGLAADVRRDCWRLAVLGLVLAAAVGAAVTLSDEPDPWLGGLRPQAALIPVIEAMITVGASLWIVDAFRRRGERSSPVRRLGRGSFVAYLVHAPITVALGVVLRDVGVPAEVKLLVVFAATVAASFAIGAALARSPRWSAIL